MNIAAGSPGGGTPIDGALDPVSVQPKVDEVSTIDDARLTIAVFSMVLAAVLGIVYYGLRLGFANPIAPVAKTVGLSLFLGSAPLALSHRKRSVEPMRAASGRLALSTIAVLSAVATAGFLLPSWSKHLALPFGIAGALTCAWQTARWCRHARWFSSIGFALFAALFALWLAGMEWGMGGTAHSPLFLENLISGAGVHLDTLFHSSIANMLRTYGVPSTGLDGTPYLAYHYGSHWVFAQLSNILDVDVMTFYQLGFPVLVLPLLFSAVLNFAVTACGAMPHRRIEGALRSNVMFWAVFASTMIGVVRLLWMQEIGSSYINPLNSESYAFGLSLLFVFLSLVVSALGDPAAHEPRPASHVRRQEYVFLLIVLPALVAAIGFAKVSLMALLVAVLAYCLVRLEGYRDRLVLASAGVVFLTFIAVYTRVSPSKSSDMGGRFPPITIVTRIAFAASSYFFVVSLLWTWVLIALRLHQEAIGDIRDLVSALRARRILDVEVVFLIAVLGLIPGMLLDLKAGELYFSDPQRWVAASLLASLVLGSNFAVTRTFRFRRWDKIRVGHVLVAVSAVAPLAAMLQNVAFPMKRMMDTNLATRSRLLQSAGVQGSPQSHINDSTALSVGLQRSELYSLVRALRTIQALPRDERRHSLLYVPSAVNDFWNYPGLACWGTPFIGPMVSGVALLDGLPRSGCRGTTFGYGSYAQSASGLGGAPTEGQLCAAVRQRGFLQVLVLVPDGKDVRVDRHVCGSNAGS